MADIKVLYVDSNGLNAEHSEAADSIKMLSLKTATYELTDTKLGHLIGGADAADEHIHDARYFRENEHLAATAGAGDAGKPVKLDVTGYLNPLIDAATLSSSINHSSLTNLSVDSHTQYTLAAGTRDFSGVIKYASHPTFNADTQLVDKKYVDDMKMGAEWQDSVITRTATPPVTPTVGDRYLIIATATGAWVGKENQIAQWDGAAWVYTVPTTGMYVSVDDETTALYLYTGATWSIKSYEATTASTGLTKVGVDVRLDSSAAGAGLGFTTGVLSVNVDGATLEIPVDTLQVKANGINDTHIDWGTGTNQVSGVDMPLADAGGYFATDNVEAALQELAGQVTDFGVNYTVGVGGVTKGDLVYISGNNTILPYGTITQGQHCVGLAKTTEIATATVKVLANDTVLTGVLSGATAGTPYYWTGSAYSTTMPATASSYVWEVGIAKNATDLSVEVRQVKKNA